MKEFFTKQEVAKQLKMTEGTVGYLIKSGRIQARKVGKDVVIDRQDLENYVKERSGKCT